MNWIIACIHVLALNIPAFTLFTYGLGIGCATADSPVPLVNLEHQKLPL